MTTSGTNKNSSANIGTLLSSFNWAILGSFIGLATIYLLVANRKNNDDNSGRNNLNRSSLNQTNFISKEKRLVIKVELPRCGIISSNPERTEIIKESLNNLKLIVNNWGIKIYTGAYNGHEVFVSSVALGSAGAAFAIAQMYSAGAECIIRYGSNDYHVDTFNETSTQRVTLVTVTDNLRGVMYDRGEPDHLIGQPIYASDSLLDAIRSSAKKHKITFYEAVCHNTDAYFATNSPCLFNHSITIVERRKKLEEDPRYKDLNHCEDMESAALFYIADRMNKHAAAVLQNIIKIGDTHVYAGKKGEDAISLMKSTFLPLVFGALSQWENEAQPTKLIFPNS